MSNEREEFVNPDSDALIAPPKNRLDAARRTIRDNVRTLDGFERMELAAEAPAHKLISQAQVNIVNTILIGASSGYYNGPQVKPERVPVLASIMRGLIAYDKTNPLAIAGDFQENDTVLLKNAAKHGGVSAEAAQMVLPIMHRLRLLAQ